MRSGYFFCLIILLSPIPCGAESPSPYRILILHSTGRDFPPFEPATREFRRELTRQSPRPVEFFDASLDMARLDGAKNEGPLTDFLEFVYAEREPDLVTALGAPAYYFCERNRARLFPSAPLLIIGADKRRLPDLMDDDRATAVNVEIDLQLIPPHITHLLPATRHLFVVMGTAPLERFWEEETRREWPPLLPNTTIHWMSDLPLDTLISKLANPPPNSAIFFGMLSRDGDGMPYLNENALELLHQSAGAPIFGFSSEQLGRGIVGGPLIDMQKVGRDAAEAGVRLLAGENPNAIHLAEATLGSPIYDWREVNRWKIPQSRLPPGNTIEFRPPSLWETHRTAAISGMAVVAIQSLMIALLIATWRRAVESDANLRLTTEAANIRLWHVDPDKNSDFDCSARWRKLFDLPENDPTQTTDVYARIHPEDQAAVAHAMDQATENGGKFDVEHRVVLRNNEVRWVASRGQAESGRTRGVSMDITQRRETEAQLDRQRIELAHLSRVITLGELSCALAHELNQPLGSILSNAQAAQQLLSRSVPDLDEIREILDDVVSEDLRAGNVIKRLRALLERGEVHFIQLDIDETLDEVLELMRSELTPQGINIVRERATPPALIMGDRVQLQQVFLNLISNARDAMIARPPGQRSLTLSTTMQTHEAHLLVKDSGTGFTVDPETLFEPFHTTKKHGLGMGLPICRSIIQAHNGKLWAKNCHSQGAEFHLTLPVIAPS